MPIETTNPARVTWGIHDTPRSIMFDDTYFSQYDGRAETRHTFIAANDLPERWNATPHFTIAELGFGTGLNCLETLYQWQRHQCDTSSPRHLTFVSFEQHIMTRADMTRALEAWPELHTLRDMLLSHLQPNAAAQQVTVEFDNATLHLQIGDANDRLPAWQGIADAWYLDGFSPSKNPELWNPDLMQSVFAHTVPGGSFATYTVAGFVRRNLIAAGFEVSKIPGHARKRASLSGRRPI